MNIKRAALPAVLAAGCVLATGCGPLNESASGPSKQNSTTSAAPTFDSSSPFDVSPVTKQGGKVLVDVGDAKVQQDPSKPMRLAYLIQGTDNTWLQSHVQGAKDEAAKLGVDLTVFDGGFDPKTQYSQYQNALTSNKFDAFIVIAADSVGSCDILTHQAPSQNVLVGVVNEPLCNRGDKDNLGAWSPGTVSTVVGTGSPAFYNSIADQIGKSLTKPTTFAYITGPAGNTSVEAEGRALQAAAKRYPNLKVPYTAYTDYSAAKALQETQNLISAHPEIGGIVSNFTALTTGIMQGLQSGGRKDVKVYDGGGSQQAIDLLKAGQIEGTAAYYPYTASACMVDLLNRAHKGEEVPRVVLNDCHGSDDGGKTEQPLIVTSHNVADFKPVY